MLVSLHAIDASLFRFCARQLRGTPELPGATDERTLTTLDTKTTTLRPSASPSATWPCWRSRSSSAPCSAQSRRRRRHQQQSSRRRTRDYASSNRRPQRSSRPGPRRGGPQTGACASRRFNRQREALSFCLEINAVDAGINQPHSLHERESA